MVAMGKQIKDIIFTWSSPHLLHGITPKEWNIWVLIKQIQTCQVLHKEKLSLYSCHNVFVFILLNVLWAPLDLFDSMLFNSLQNLDKYFLTHFQFFTLGFSSVLHNQSCHAPNSEVVAEVSFFIKHVILYNLK